MLRRGLLLPLGVHHGIEPPESHDALEERRDRPQPPELAARGHAVPREPRAGHPPGLRHVDGEHGDEDGPDQPPVGRGAAEGEEAVERVPGRRARPDEAQRGGADEVQADAEEDDEVEARGRRVAVDPDVAQPQPGEGRLRHLDEPGAGGAVAGQRGLDGHGVAPGRRPDGHAAGGHVGDLRARRRGGPQAVEGPQVQLQLAGVVLVHVRDHARLDGGLFGGGGIGVGHFVRLWAGGRCSGSFPLHPVLDCVGSADWPGGRPRREGGRYIAIAYA